MGFGTKEEVYNGLSHHETAPGTARPLAHSDWLPQFRVFNNKLWYPTPLRRRRTTPMLGHAAFLPLNQRGAGSELWQCEAA